MSFNRIMAAILAASGVGGSGTVQAIVSSAVVGIPMSFVGSGSPIQWNINGTPVAGATGSTYTPVSGDAQKTLTVTVNGTTSAGVIVSPASAAYATALAAATTGQYFTAPDAAATKLYVYQKQSSGFGWLTDVTANAGATNAVTAAVRALPLPTVTPLVDFEPMETRYGVKEYQNYAAGAGKRTLNLLGNYAHAGTAIAHQGSPTITPRVADRHGGTLATQITIASGAAAATDHYLPVLVPPGQWTLSFWGIAITTGQGAANQNIKFGYNSTTTLASAALTTTWQQFTQTFNNTSETALNQLWIHGDYPSAASVNYDFAICDVALTPGDATQVPTAVDLDSHPSLMTTTALNYSSGGYELEALTNNTSGGGNFIIAKSPTLTTLTGWSHMMTISAAPGSNSAVALDARGSLFTNTLNLLQLVATDNGQSDIITKVTGQVLRDGNWAGLGRVTFGIVASSTTVAMYVNGILIDTVLLSAGGLTNMAIVALNGLLNSASVGTGNTLLGDMSSSTFWTSALTSAQMLDAHNKIAARAAAKGLTLAPLTSVIIPMGDSISYGYQDASNMGGWVNRAVYSLITTTSGNRIPVNMQAITGYNFSQLVSTELTPTLAAIATYVAAGIRPIVTLLIGANDDGQLTSQAAIESYYNGSYSTTGTSVCGVAAQLRTAGAKVVLVTHIPDNRGYVYDSGTGASSGVTGSGTGAIAATATSTAAGLNGQSFNGWRGYLNALIKSGSGFSADAVADFGSESHFSGTYLTCNGGAPSAIYSDTLHPNGLGYSYLATVFAAAVQSLIV